MEENKKHGKEMPNVLNYDLTNTKLKFKDLPPSPVEEDRNSGEPQLKEFNGHEGQNPKESMELVTENPSREAEMQSEEGLDDNREEIACKASELRTEDSDVDKKEKPSKDVGFPLEESDLNKDENPGKEVELKSEDHDVNKEENPIKDVGLQSEDHDVNKEENPSKDVGLQSEDLDVNMEENPGKDKDPAINKGENLSEHTELQSEDPDVNMDENPSKDVGLQYEDSDVLKDENSSKDLGLQSEDLNVHKDENLSKDAELQSEDSGANKDENPSKNVGLQSDHPDAMQEQSPGEDEDSQSQDLDDLDEQSPGETDDSLSEDLDDDMGVSSSEEEEHNPRKNVKFPTDDHSLVKIAVSKTPADSKVDVNANGVHGKSQTDGSKVSFETKSGDDENGNEPMDAVKGKDAVKGMKFSGREMKEEVSKSKLDDIKEEETLPKFDSIKEEMLKSEVDVVMEEVLKPKLDAEPVVVKSSNHSFLLESAEGDESGTEEEQAAFMKELETFFRERLMEFKPPKFYGVELNLLKPDLDIYPVFQVRDLKLVNSQQLNADERYRITVSDGLHFQQGMLATQKNEMVRSGKVQKGTVIKLTRFVCNLIQSRPIIIIVDLEVIHEACPLIGEPQLYVITMNGPALAGGLSTPAQPSVSRPNVGMGSQQFPRTEAPFGSSFPRNSGSGGFAGTSPPPIHSKFESAADIRGSVPFSALYNDQNTGLPNNRVEVSRAPSYGCPQPAYQQQQQQQQRSPMYTNRAPVGKPEDAPRIIPIDGLNLYQRNWTIKARVTTKGDLRGYKNARGNGKVFSFDLLDKDGGEIRVTCFNEVADQFFPQIQAGKLYYISKGSLKPAQKAYNHLRNDYEITLDRNSTIQECFEDDHSIPGQQFYFCNIGDLETMENNTIVDVIGVVTCVTPVVSISRKGSGDETKKRSLQLKDTTGRSVELTIWGDFSTGEGCVLEELCASGVNPILAVKSARVYDYNGKALGTIATSQLFIDPPFLPNTRMLREWFDNEGKNTPVDCLSKGASSIGMTEEGRKVISQIKDECLGTGEKPDWITISGTISFIKVDNFCYTACPNMSGDRKCSKKVTNNEYGKWYCNKCNLEFDECEYRYILQLQIQDHTGLTWATAFQETGEEIMGVPARDLYEMKYERPNEEEFAEAISKVRFTKFLIKLKVKEEMYDDTSRVKSTVVKVEKVNWGLESKYLLELMDKLKAKGSSSFVPKAENISPNTGFVSVGNRQPISMGNREYGQASQAGQYGSAYGQASQFGSQFVSSRVPPANGSSGVTPGRYGGGLR